MYDYIIVGAGSAGCVLANRLTEDPETSVLLIEAGGNDDLETIHNPTTFLQLLGSAVDWAYFTEEEPHLRNRRIFWPRGKVLGGSSSINWLMYVRGNHSDYDHWQKLGNSSWGYTDVLPYFKKSENYEHSTSDYRGRGGPINVIETPSSNPLTQAFLEAGVELGWPRNDDYNGATQEGFGMLQSTIGQEGRSSTATGYLHPVEQRPNLSIWTQTLVTRLLFDGTRAVGVAYRQADREQEVQAKKEVILSGGAINSPHLLMLSGIGPADLLQSLDIPVVADLPGVGKNLQDHPGVLTYYKTKPSFSQFGSHPETVAFVKTHPDLLKPDLQIIGGTGYFPPTVPGSGFSFATILVSVQSRGHLTLRSTDPTQYPAIYANYLSAEEDLQALVDGVKLVRRLAQTQAYAPFYERDDIPGPQIESDEQIIEFLRNAVQTMFHPIGTCKMGHDAMAVVDEQLRVHGIERLRVVDASIMPTIPNGNTNAPTIMIAEKSADELIKKRAE
jgi:choline dehydrogenase